MTQQVADDLRAAKALIASPEKWAKGPDRFLPKQGSARMCAMDTLLSPRHSYSTGLLEMRDTLVRHLPSGFTMVATYNDHPATTYADILALFDRAIAAESAT